MRADLFGVLAEIPELERTDLNFQPLLRIWFNRGFLVLRQISWENPASILENLSNLKLSMQLEIGTN